MFVITDSTAVIPSCIFVVTCPGVSLGCISRDVIAGVDGVCEYTFARCISQGAVTKNTGV